jgi:beta-aspartyl-peptidase (threonine type)
VVPAQGLGVNTPAVAIHAGAGDRGAALLEQEARYGEALRAALDGARAVLEADGGAVAAVQSAIIVMEDFELFNAGRGSALCADGSVEMSAALMSSRDRAAGAVAGVRRTRNPIIGAHFVMQSPHVLMAGEAADAFAAAVGAEQRPNAFFVTERQRARLQAASAGRDHATVGAVCVDATGVLAAGTSTGGIRGQPPGRVGDSPIIGAGTWADDRVAVSCTGDGEAFIRAGAARYIAALRERGMSVAEAAERALAEVHAFGASGGLIAVGPDGATALPFLTEVMPRAVWRSGEDPVVWVAD